MVEASKSIINVFVDCDWGKKNADLSAKFGVRGYPTVIFVDSKGNQIEELGDRSPEGAKKQIEAIAKKYGKAFPATFAEVAEAAKKEEKLVLFIFATKGKDSMALEEALSDDALAEALGKFVIARTVIKRDDAEAKRFAVASYEQPVLLVLDPAAEKPEVAPLRKIVGKKTVKELLKEFQSIKRPAKPEGGGN
ncbi:MAG: hypothetical protein EXS13_12675 [Planctomycetes bacterium]|nr:hypothetical protein [Planctomycetota bacterium]